MSETKTIDELSRKIPAVMHRLSFFMGDLPGLFYLISGTAEQVEKTGDLSQAIVPLRAAWKAAEAAGNDRAMKIANNLGGLCRLILCGDAYLAPNGAEHVEQSIAACMSY